jgi:hypothetical protein
MTKTELSLLTVAELRVLAKKMKVVLSASLKKAEIVTLLAAASKKEPKGKKTSNTGKKNSSPKKAGAKAGTKKASSPRTGIAAKSENAAPARTRSRGKMMKSTGVVRETSASKPVEEVGSRRVAAREWRLVSGAESTERVQDRIADAKFYTGEAKRGPSSGVLPIEYGMERLVLLPRDSQTIFAYWEVAQQRLDQERSRLGAKNRFCIRVYDVTDVIFDGGNAVSYIDHIVSERAGSRYFELDRPGHVFCAELGLLSSDGRFSPIVRSAPISLPREGEAVLREADWTGSAEEVLRFFGMAGPGESGLSSAEIEEAIRKRRLLEISSPGQTAGEQEVSRRR